MKTRLTCRTGADRPRETVDGSGRASGTIGTGECETCLKKIKPGKHGERRRFCSVGCRRLAWSLRALAGALASGHAEGLRGELRKLAEAA